MASPEDKPSSSGSINKNRINEIFEKLDRDKDGRISVQELSAALKGHMPESDKKAEELISMSDTNSDHGLNFEEFLSYVRDQETQLKLAFKKLDSNNDQKIQLPIEMQPNTRGEPGASRASCAASRLLGTLVASVINASARQRSRLTHMRRYGPAHLKHRTSYVLILSGLPSTLRVAPAYEYELWRIRSMLQQKSSPAFM